MKRIEDYQEALAFVERLKEAGVSAEKIRIYEWTDIIADGDCKVLKRRERYGIDVVKTKEFKTLEAAKKFYDKLIKAGYSEAKIERCEVVSREYIFGGDGGNFSGKVYYEVIRDEYDE